MSLKSVAGSAAGQAIVLGAAALGAYYLYKQSRQNILRPVTPDATNAYWNSSLGDLTSAMADWYTNGWGSSWDWTYGGFTEEEAAYADKKAQEVNNQVGWTGGGFL